MDLLSLSHIKHVEITSQKQILEFKKAKVQQKILGEKFK